MTRPLPWLTWLAQKLYAQVAPCFSPPSACSRLHASRKHPRKPARIAQPLEGFHPDKHSHTLEHHPQADLGPICEWARKLCSLVMKD